MSIPSKIRTANEIRQQEGYWSLLFQTSQFISNKIQAKAIEEKKAGSPQSRTSYKQLCQTGRVSRPYYGFCAWLAGKQAERLGYDKIALVEFGVAGGNGLMNLEKHVSRLEQHLDVSYEIYGFDLGEGLPAPEEYRDSPYYWDRGHYDMDVERLKRNLDRSELVLGNVADTVPDFISEYDPAPIGAVSVDLDYYSSTKDALQILSCKDEYLLPRVPMYFDDVLGGDGLRMTIPQIGEAQAIREFNEDNDQGVIGKLQFPEGSSKPVKPRRQYAYHKFDHNMYNEYIGEEDRQLPLKIDD
jgi:hypothetical protein